MPSEDLKKKAFKHVTDTDAWQQQARILGQRAAVGMTQSEENIREGAAIRKSGAEINAAKRAQAAAAETTGQKGAVALGKAAGAIQSATAGLSAAKAKIASEDIAIKEEAASSLGDLQISGEQSDIATDTARYGVEAAEEENYENKLNTQLNYLMSDNDKLPEGDPRKKTYEQLVKQAEDNLDMIRLDAP